MLKERLTLLSSNIWTRVVTISQFHFRITIWSRYYHVLAIKSIFNFVYCLFFHLFLANKSPSIYQCRGKKVYKKKGQSTQLLVKRQLDELLNERCTRPNVFAGLFTQFYQYYQHNMSISLLNITSVNVLIFVSSITLWGPSSTRSQRRLCGSIVFLDPFSSHLLWSTCDRYFVIVISSCIARPTSWDRSPFSVACTEVSTTVSPGY